MAEPVVRNIQEVMDQLAEQIREEYAKPITAVRAAPSLGTGDWAIGLLAVVGVALLVGLPLGRQPVTAPPQVADNVTLYETDACAQRQAAIIRAIGAYIHDHGTAPDDLAALQPHYLSEPAVNPESGTPYLYSNDGDTIALRCPNPDLHAVEQPVNRPQVLLSDGQ